MKWFYGKPKAAGCYWLFMEGWEEPSVVGFDLEWGVTFLGNDAIADLDDPEQNDLFKGAQWYGPLEVPDGFIPNDLLAKR